MVSRMALILYVLAAKEIFWVYEQPGSSLLWTHPRMEGFFNSNQAFRIWTWMGAFGAKSPKGSVLVGPVKDIAKLCRELPKKPWASIAKKSASKSGKVSVSGTADVKASQSYTAAFGFAVLSAWLGYETGPELWWGDVPKPRVWKTLRSQAERWDDARLDEVFHYLTPN